MMPGMKVSFVSL